MKGSTQNILIHHQKVHTHHYIQSYKVLNTTMIQKVHTHHYMQSFQVLNTSSNKYTWHKFLNTYNTSILITTKNSFQPPPTSPLPPCPLHVLELCPLLWHFEQVTAKYFLLNLPAWLFGSSTPLLLFFLGLPTYTCWYTIVKIEFIPCSHVYYIFCVL